MILAYINNYKLFIQFDRIIKSGLIFITDKKELFISKEVNSSEFETFDLPKHIKEVHIIITADKKKINKTIMV